MAKLRTRFFHIIIFTSCLLLGYNLKLSYPSYTLLSFAYQRPDYHCAKNYVKFNLSRVDLEASTPDSIAHILFTNENYKMRFPMEKHDFKYVTECSTYKIREYEYLKFLFIKELLSLNLPFDFICLYEVDMYFNMTAINAIIREHSHVDLIFLKSDWCNFMDELKEMFTGYGLFCFNTKSQRFKRVMESTESILPLRMFNFSFDTIPALAARWLTDNYILTNEDKYYSYCQFHRQNITSFNLVHFNGRGKARNVKEFKRKLKHMYQSVNNNNKV